MRFYFLMLLPLTILMTAMCPPVTSAQDSTPVNTASDAKRIASKKHRFSFIPPDEWKQTKPSGSTFLEFVGPARQMAANVNVRAVAYDGTDPREICAAIKVAFADSEDEWTPVSESFLEINGHKSFFLIATQMNTRRGIRFKTKFLQCFIFNGTDGYVITYSCLPSLYNELRPLFEKSAKSIRINVK